MMKTMAGGYMGTEGTERTKGSSVRVPFVRVPGTWTAPLV